MQRPPPTSAGTSLHVPVVLLVVIRYESLTSLFPTTIPSINVTYNHAHQSIDENIVQILMETGEVYHQSKNVPFAHCKYHYPTEKNLQTIKEKVVVTGVWLECETINPRLAESALLKNKGFSWNSHLGLECMLKEYAVCYGKSLTAMSRLCDRLLMYYLYFVFVVLLRHCSTSSS